MSVVRSGIFGRLYLRHEEDAARREYARANGTSLNYVARAGIRLLTGLPVPSSLVDELYDRLVLERAKRGLPPA